MKTSPPNGGSATRAAGLLAFAVVLSGCSDLPTKTYPSEIVHLPQGWTNADRQTYYYTAQGTELHGIRYDWLRYLEMPLSKDLLSDPKTLMRWGFLYEPEQLLPGYQPPPYNPGNFPIGFTHHKPRDGGGALLDITCAACHTGQIEYQGKGIRIDGGPAMHAFAATELNQFIPTLLLSLIATYSNPLKFDRFAKNVLGLAYPSAKEILHARLGESIDLFSVEGFQIATGDLFSVKEGYGRIDALDHIAATVFGSDLDPANFREGNAPVSYPHLWDMWKFDWAQWNGSVAQPMARNAGEAIGVKAFLELVDGYGDPLPPDSMYASSVLIDGLHCIETTLWKLQAPIWDETVLPPIDWNRVERGRQVFDTTCAHCHGPHYYPSREQQATPDKPLEWKMVVVPTSEVGTDPSVVDNFLDYRYDASALDPSNPALKSIDGGSALEIVTAAVIEKKYKEFGIANDSAARWEMDGWGRKIETRVERGYKARPLHGIWATGPFLHNGSVPTLYDLLGKEEERPDSFWVGTRRFDPVKVGYVTRDSIGSFLFDTSIPGNRNTGHQFRDRAEGGAGIIGGALTEEERWSVIEFLKVFGSRPEDFGWSGEDGRPPPGYRVEPLGPSACSPTVQGPSQHLAAASLVGPPEDQRIPRHRAADTLSARARLLWAERKLASAPTARDSIAARTQIALFDSVLAAAREGRPYR